MTAPILQSLDLTKTKIITTMAVLEELERKFKALPCDFTVVHIAGKGHHLHSDAAEEFAATAGPWIVKNYFRESQNTSSKAKTAESVNSAARL